MVLDDHGSFQWQISLWMANQIPSFSHRKKFHVKGKSLVFRLWPSKELPKLCMARPGFTSMNIYVQHGSPEKQQNAQKSFPSFGGCINRGNNLAHQNCASKSFGLIISRGNIF